MGSRLYRMASNNQSLLIVLCMTLIFSSLGPVFDGSGGNVQAVGNPQIGVTYFAGGSGTPSDPYVVTDAVYLNNVRNHLSAHYILGANIDLDVAPYNENEGWLPIGTYANSFKGTFDGAGFTISGLTIDRTTDKHVGLFGYIQNAEIANVKLENVDVKGKEHVGGLVGYSTVGSKINGSSAIGEVSGEKDVGGLVGTSYGEIDQSYAEVTVEGTMYVGGLAGKTHQQINESYATAKVTGTEYVGGLVGVLSGGEIRQSFATGDVTGTGYAIGGLVGDKYDNSTVRNSYASGAVEGNINVGGLVGFDRGGTIENSYALGAVTGNDDRYSGGLVGYGDTGANVNDSFYDVVRTGQNDTGKGAGKTTAEMQQQATFTNWDFDDVWFIGENSSYPKLQQFVTELNYDEIEYTLPIGSTKQINLDVVYVDNSSTAITSPAKYETDDANIATVSATGLLTGEGVGSTTLTTQLGQISNDVDVIVSDRDVIFVKEGGDDHADGDSWANAYATLQKALDEATPGTNIWIAKGTYTPTKQIHPADSRTATFQMKNGVAIYGGFAGDDDQETVEDRDFVNNETILSGDLLGNDDNNHSNTYDDNAYHVFYHDYSTNLDESAILDGVSITAGNASHIIVSEFSSGAGMYNKRSSPTLRNVIFHHNDARHFGGGIYNLDGSSPTLINVVFQENSALLGGGMFNDTDTNPQLINVEINGNDAGQFGAGMYNLQSSPIMSNVLLINNRAKVSGGGMYNYEGSKPILTNVIISGNEVSNRDGTGAGIHNRPLSEPILTNVTISGNKSDKGGALYNETDSQVEIRNSIIWGNSSSIDEESIGTSTIIVEHSIFEGGIEGEGVLDVDPQFVDPEGYDQAPISSGDYRLKASSPAINAGNNKYFDAGANPDLSHIMNDLDGAERIVGLAIDMGVYEHPNPPVVEIISMNNLVDIEVNVGTDRANIPFPDQVEVTLSNNMTIQLDVTWDQGDPQYDKDSVGTYEFTGTLVLIAGIANSAGHEAKVSVIVKATSGGNPGSGNGSGGGSGSGSRTPGKGSGTTKPSEPQPKQPEKQRQPTKITFDDIASHWAKADIEFLASIGIIKGVSEKLFAPDKSINRAELVALLVCGLNLSLDAELQVTSQLFSDVGHNAWYAEVVQTAVQAGLVSGYPDGTFRPHQQITREELAVIIYRASLYVEKQVETVDTQNILANFGDRVQIADWAVEALAFSVDQGIIRGMGTGLIAPKKEATRAEAAVMLKRLLFNLNLLEVEQ